MATDSPLAAPEIERRMLDVGVDLRGHQTRRSGTFVHLDDRHVQASAQVEGLEVMDIKQALEKYDWLGELYGSLVPADKDEYTRQAEANLHGGYFIRALPGARIEAPVQACLYLLHEGLVQCVHNVIIAEEDSYLPIITGCAAHFSARRGMHIGLSEFFVRPGATVRFVMIHAWGEEIVVRPRSAALVERDGAISMDYVCLEKVRDVQMYPAVHLVGERAVARSRSVVAAAEGTKFDLGSLMRLAAPGTRGEILSRNVSSGGEITARGRLVAETGEVQGRLECKGLLLSERGRISALPELDARHPNVELSHEAAVGRIGEEQINYLRARGLTEDEAIAAIVHGFLDVGIEGLPQLLDQRISNILAMSQSGSLEEARRS
ncbi:MAG: SufD family Fe-S cluster assembly protein [Armatimonadetes bacterium]|nr:SufD family Fe-S cluster assembly protein [Armatimonadota bacterium]